MDPWVVVLLRARAGVLPCGDPWVVVQLSAQAGVPQYADQWAAALRPAQEATLPSVGLRAMSQLVVAAHTQTFMAVPILITAGVLSRQVLR